MNNLLGVILILLFVLYIVGISTILILHWGDISSYREQKERDDDFDKLHTTLASPNRILYEKVRREIGLTKRNKRKKPSKKKSTKWRKR